MHQAQREEYMTNRLVAAVQSLALYELDQLCEDMSRASTSFGKAFSSTL